MSLFCVWLFLVLIIGNSGSPGGATIRLSSAATSRTIIVTPGATRPNVTISSPSQTILPPNINTSSSLRSPTASIRQAVPSPSSSTVVSSPLPHPGPTTLVRRSTSSQVRSGFCARYTEPPCQDILKKSLTQFNETERYFDSKYGINGSANFLVLLLEESNKYVKDKKCKWLIEVALCQYTLSPCMPNGQPYSFCREDCQSLTNKCKASLNRLIGSAGVITEIKDYDFAHLALPTNCSFYRSGKSGNKSCIYLGLFDHSKSEDLSSSRAILWISIGAGSFVLFLTFIIVLTICIKQRRRKRNERKEIEEIRLRKRSSVGAASTMKARLSLLLEVTSLSSKILEMYDPNKLRQFSLDSIEYVSDLGEGQFGLVFKGVALGIDEHKDATEETVVAVKTLKKDCSENSKEEFNQEVALMSALDHPNVVKLLAVATEEEPFCMIFEFMEFGDLNQFLRKLKPLDEAEEPPDFELCLEDFLSICEQVASGMSYLASLHFVHRDLATRNCLVGKGLVVKIADFGLARDIYSSDYYKVRGDAMLPVRWMPPEAILHGRFTVESDVYSYGVLMWEVFTYALQPYYGYTNEEVITFAKQGVLLGQPEECPDHIYKLMLDCWLRTPEKRPNFTSIIKRLVKDPPVMSDYCAPRTLSVTPEEPTMEHLSDTDRYVSPNANTNNGFKSDKDLQVDKNDEKVLPVVNLKYGSTSSSEIRF